MSYAVDTNVLLRSIDVGHPAQQVALDAMIRLRHSGELHSVFPQNLIEFWAVGTRPVANNVLGLTIARAELEVTSLKKLFALLLDTPDIFSEWERIVLKNKVAGKQAHDARLVAATSVHNLTHLLTFNTADFKRFSEITAVSPTTILSDEQSE